METKKKNRKQLLIEAACEVFSQKGYRDATIADICERAESNIASVNYYFGDKEHLYAQVWKYAFEESLKAYPPEGDLPSNAPATERLKARIGSLMNRILDDGKVGYFSRMLFTEMANPTDSIDEVIKKTVMPQKEQFFDILSKLLGEAATKENVCLCAVCVMNTCIMFSMHNHMRKKILVPKDGMNITREMLIEHIYTFAMGGIEECRKKYLEGK
ncbi:MAG: CerR family C-terminal domain-containing protein [Sedimentisphaeraceae bacterium JB056]